MEHSPRGAILSEQVLDLSRSVACLSERLVHITSRPDDPLSYRCAPLPLWFDLRLPLFGIEPR